MATGASGKRAPARRKRSPPESISLHSLTPAAPGASSHARTCLRPGQFFMLAFNFTGPGACSSMLPPAILRDAPLAVASRLRFALMSMPASLLRDSHPLFGQLTGLGLHQDLVPRRGGGFVSAFGFCSWLALPRQNSAMMPSLAARPGSPGQRDSDPAPRRGSSTVPQPGRHRRASPGRCRRGLCIECAARSGRHRALAAAGGDEACRAPPRCCGDEAGGAPRVSVAAIVSIAFAPGFRLPTALRPSGPPRAALARPAFRPGPCLRPSARSPRGCPATCPQRRCGHRCSATNRIPRQRRGRTGGKFCRDRARRADVVGLLLEVASCRRLAY